MRGRWWRKSDRTGPSGGVSRAINNPKRRRVCRSHKISSHAWTSPISHILQPIESRREPSSSSSYRHAGRRQRAWAGHSLTGFKATYNSLPRVYDYRVCLSGTDCSERRGGAGGGGGVPLRYLRGTGAAVRVSGPVGYAKSTER